MTWDADRPKGNQAFNVGDEAIAENFAWLEAALGISLVFPGTATPAGSSGRFKTQSLTIAAGDALSDLTDGQVVWINNLRGSSQEDGDGASTHVWPYRYSAAGGGSQLADFVPLTLPVLDDGTDETTVAGLLGANDSGLLLLRKVGAQYVLKAWNGTAIDAVVTEAAARDEAVSATASPIPTSRYIDDDSSGGNGDHLVWTGGSGTDNRAEITTPTAGEVALEVYWEAAVSAGGDRQAAIALRTKVGAGAWATLETYPIDCVENGNAGRSGFFRITSPTLNTTHSFTLVFRNESGGSFATSSGESTSATLPDGTASVQRIIAKMVAA